MYQTTYDDIMIKINQVYDKQSDDFKRNILDEESLIVTIEAGNISSWKKYF